MYLKVNEIFYSLEGETTSAGFPSLFIRLAGCNLRCCYCDTEYAREAESGSSMDFDEIIGRAESYEYIHHITITGGEPLAQPNSIQLMKILLRKQYRVQLETNGSISLTKVPAGVKKIVDVKAPGSGEGGSFLPENIKFLRKTDELKFVILNIEDYEFSADFIKKNKIDKNVVINFSPVSETFSAEELGGLILRDRLPVRLNLQLHKIIWPQGEPKKEKE